MRLLFAVSDHGFGHATRTIALLRACLLQDPSLRVRIVAGPGSSTILSGSFESDPRVEVVVRSSDPGLLLLPGTLRVDTPATVQAWREWISSWPAWASDEADESHASGPVDAVIADGTPPALMVARILGVPALLLGNFSWSDVLRWHVSTELLETVRKTLSLADASFAYPFALPFDGAPPPRALPLVARRPTRRREEIRAALGVSPEERLIYLSSGQSSDPSSVWRAASAFGARPLVPWRAPPITGAVRIPRHEIEGQDFLASCDLVVGKIGYGTLSEALVAGVAMVMVLVDRTPETAPLERGMREARAGEALNEMDDLTPSIGRWLGRGGGVNRPYVVEDSAGAARLLLSDLRARARGASETPQTDRDCPRR